MNRTVLLSLLLEEDAQHGDLVRRLSKVTCHEGVIAWQVNRRFNDDATLAHGPGDGPVDHAVRALEEVAIARVLGEHGSLGTVAEEAIPGIEALPAGAVQLELEAMRVRCSTWTAVALGIGVTPDLLGDVMRADYLTPRAACLWATRLDLSPALLWPQHQWPQTAVEEV